MAFRSRLGSIKTYSASTAHARYEVIAAKDIITVLHDYCRIDLLHFYPPCQFLSPSNPYLGRNDESNEASLLATEELLKKIRPRIVTLEDTFGLHRTLDNLLRFIEMIWILTKLGLSVQWKAFNLQYFRLPLPRRRVFFSTS